uniref:Secreted protein n=1 Tax=Anopheles culicifacies TaxID=139723 RepID=A0A182LRW4_9DIPT
MSPVSFALTVLLLLVGYVHALPIEEGGTAKDKPLGGLADGGAIHEEVVVAASLYVRKKPATSLRRQEREIRDDHVTHPSNVSHANGLDSPAKGQPHLGKHHHKVQPNWKNSNGLSTKVEHQKTQNKA